LPAALRFGLALPRLIDRVLARPGPLFGDPDDTVLHDLTTTGESA
jgi:hypothetical protein